MPTDAPYPFDGYRMYGPRIHQDRRIVYLVRIGNHIDRTTISYAKYLLSIHLRRWLDSHEQVDHINDDKLDDRIENYQILNYGTHSTKHSKGCKTQILECKFCSKKFKTRDDGKLDRKFCSRQCLYDSQRGPKLMTTEQYNNLFK